MGKGGGGRQVRIMTLRSWPVRNIESTAEWSGATNTNWASPRSIPPPFRTLRVPPERKMDSTPSHSTAPAGAAGASGAAAAAPPCRGEKWEKRGRRGRGRRSESKMIFGSAFNLGVSSGRRSAPEGGRRDARRLGMIRDKGTPASTPMSCMVLGRGLTNGRAQHRGARKKVGAETGTQTTFGLFRRLGGQLLAGRLARPVACVDRGRRARPAARSRRAKTSNPPPPAPPEALASSLSSQP